MYQVMGIGYGLMKGRFQLAFFPIMFLVMDRTNAAVCHATAQTSTGFWHLITMRLLSISPPLELHDLIIDAFAFQPQLPLRNSFTM